MSTLKSGKVRCTALLGSEQRVQDGLRGELLNNPGKREVIERGQASDHQVIARARMLGPAQRLHDSALAGDSCHG
jgi:hypothetical protein